MLPASPRESHSTTAIPRRSFLGAGLASCLGSLLLPDILRLRAAAGTEKRPTAVIFVYLAGGPSQHETFDPKPDAPAEYRGPFQSIPTRVPGVRFSETMPKLADMMAELTIVRSICHREGSHIAEHVVESGYFLRNIANARAGEMPAVGCVTARVRGGGMGGLPGFVTLPQPSAYCGSAHLGRRYDPFGVNGDPNLPDFRVENLARPNQLTRDVLQERQLLLRSLNQTSRVLDDTSRAIDAYQAQALELVMGERALRAFDLAQEPNRLRERYGRNDMGQRMLLARRLVEAQVPFVAVRFTPGVGPDWDDHADLPGRMRQRAPVYDQGLSALIEDLRQRGLNRDVLLVAMGEFGRTPRVNQNAGRDHWPAVASVLLAGGSYRMGQVIGASDSRGGAVTQSPYSPQSVLAMVYRHLGIDPATTFPDFTGRPRHILEEREPIAELL
jgi:uncharacterized protein (DUF1501 family)